MEEWRVAIIPQKEAGFFPPFLFAFLSETETQHFLLTIKPLRPSSGFDKLTTGKSVTGSGIRTILDVPPSIAKHICNVRCCFAHQRQMYCWYSAGTLVHYLAMSLRALRGRTLMTLRAGLAAKTCSCLVNGLMPLRSGVAAL